MSQKFNANREVGDILAKSRKNLMERIETFRLQIKEVRERELAKSLIPTHDHRPGTTVGSGTEDVPYGKINPKGVDKSMGKNAVMGYPEPTSVAKAELCKKCGGMHKPLEKCGEMTTAKKAELIDEMGKRSSNSEVTKFKEGDKAPEVKAKGSGGVVLPGSKLKKALTAGMGSGAPSTKVNDLGKATPALAARMAVSAGVAKPKPNYVKPPTGSTKTTPTLGARMAQQTGMAKAGLMPAKAPAPKSPSVAMSGNLPPGKVPFKGSSGGAVKLPGSHLKSKTVSMTVQPDAERKSEAGMTKAASMSIQPSREDMGPSDSPPDDAGHRCETHEYDGEKPCPKCQAKTVKKDEAASVKVPKSWTDAVKETKDAGPKLLPKPAKPLMNAEPPMAKPPSGANMGTAVPSSKAGNAMKPAMKKEESMAKGMFSQAAQNADPRSASFSAHTATQAAAKPAPAAPMPGAAAQSGRAASFGAAMGGAFAPKGPINSGLELDTKPKAPALGLASPKAAGALPKPAAAKPGIFGKLLGKKP